MKKGCAHVIFGPIGAGKSTFSLELSKQYNAIKFSTDEWFKNLFFDDMNGMPELPWTFERISRCETQIWSIAMQSINCGNDVIFDLGLQRLEDRERIKLKCEEMDVEYQFYCLVADKNIRKERVVERNNGTGDTFSFPVSPKMFEIADSMFEKPKEPELEDTKFLDTGKIA